MKKILLVIAMSMLLSCAVASASPYTDFERGTSSAEIGIIRSELKTSDGGGSIDWDKKTNLDFGVTTGLSDKFALQYKYQNLDSSSTYLYGYTGKVDGKVHELNLLYKLDPHAYAFLGIQRLSGDLTISGSGSADIDSTTVAQIGVTGVTKLSDKLNGWGTIALGDDNYSYELGLGYGLAANTDLNLFYRYKKFDNLEFKNSGYEFDAKSKGLGVSVTYKF